MVQCAVAAVGTSLGLFGQRRFGQRRSAKFSYLIKGEGGRHFFPQAKTDKDGRVTDSYKRHLDGALPPPYPIVFVGEADAPAPPRAYKNLRQQLRRSTFTELEDYDLPQYGVHGCPPSLTPLSLRLGYLSPPAPRPGY